VRLLPKEEKFWTFFTSQTAYLCEASDLLLKSAESGNSEIAGASIRIKALERKSTSLLQDLQLRLHKSFVTPIDPEDISLLSEHLDHLLDEIEAISYRLAAYHFEPIPPLMVNLSRRMHEGASLIERAFGLLSINESVDKPCNQILDIEERADQLIREEVTRLFAEEKDAIALMKKKEIYDIFERLSDSCQALANSLQNVVVKNS
jgi:uncharacterized protein Yka (UPF0111/DUF47 family)